MQYWWVNQNQTYKHEVPGGYMWSPKVNIDGGRNQFYINMTLVQPGDLVYSFCDTYIKAVGTIRNKAVSSGKPTEFGSVGQNWSDDGWFVEVDFKELDSPVKPKEYMDMLLPTLPEKYSPLQPSGNGNQVYLCNIPGPMASVINSLLNGQVEDYLNEIVYIRNPEEDQLAAEILISNRQDIPETEKLQLIKSRRGQGLFRSRVCIIEKSCRVTGLSNHNYLRASHIKPWSKSSDIEKLDGNNGLMLSPHIDYLFDKGFISFSDEGDLLISNKLDTSISTLWNIDLNINVGKFNKTQSEYLKYHRLNIFINKE